MPFAQSPRLTKRTVEALKPSAARYDVFYAELRGFAIRVHPSGRKTYRFKYVAAGRQRVVTIGEHGAPLTAEYARTQAQVLRGKVAVGEDPAAERVAARQAASADVLTVAALVDRWLLEGCAAAPNKRESSWRHDASRLRRHIVPLLGSVAVSALRRADIERAQRDIVAGATAADIKTGRRGRAIVRGGRAAARAAILSFSACLSWAVSHDLIKANPAALVRKLALSKRERFLSDAEAARLLDTITTMQEDGSLKPVFADVFRLLLLTGARKTEIAGLAWNEVHLDRAVIKLADPRGKNGEKAIMLNAPAASLIAARPRGAHFVFPSPTDSGGAPFWGCRPALTLLAATTGSLLFGERAGWERQC